MHTPRMNYRQSMSLNEAVISAITGKPLSEEEVDLDEKEHKGKPIASVSDMEKTDVFKNLKDTEKTKVKKLLQKALSLKEEDQQFNPWAGRLSALVGQTSQQIPIFGMGTEGLPYGLPPNHPSVVNGTAEAGDYYPPSDLMMNQYDYNGDGQVDFSDLLIMLSAWSSGLPYMSAENYIKYMESDARSGRKQKGGAQLDIGTTKGSMTSRPPAAPPAAPATGTTAK